MAEPRPRPYVHTCTEGLVVYRLEVWPAMMSADRFVRVMVDNGREKRPVQCTSSAIVGWDPRLPSALRDHVLDALAAAHRRWRE